MTLPLGEIFAASFEIPHVQDTGVTKSFIEPKDQVSPYIPSPPELAQALHAHHHHLSSSMEGNPLQKGSSHTFVSQQLSYSIESWERYGKAWAVQICVK